MLKVENQCVSVQSMEEWYVLNQKQLYYVQSCMTKRVKLQMSVCGRAGQKVQHHVC